jgi:LmbE family N-acetylglucosaminyl deacetylase
MTKKFRPAPGQTSNIFINYRRDDASGQAGRLSDRLKTYFGEDNVFLDVSSTASGEDYSTVIKQGLESCDILLAVIGKQWASITDKQGNRRLNNPSDLVRQEIAHALSNQRIRVIPVLVQGASMPEEQELPRDMLNIRKRQAIDVRDHKWDSDVKGLIKEIENSLKEQAEKIPAQKPSSIFELKNDGGLTVLALGAHADDIELGCAATLLYLKKYLGARIIYQAFCEYIWVKGKRKYRLDEMQASAKMLGAEFHCYSYTDRELPNEWNKVQDDIKNLREIFKPDLVLVPSLRDTHQDHRVVAEGAAREFRHGQALWHYEIKQYGQDRFDPNIFVNVSLPARSQSREFLEFCKKRGANGRDLAHLKVHIIQKCMTSQAERPEFNPELLFGIMRFRGMQSSPYVQYAEAFEGRVLGFN